MPEVEVPPGWENDYNDAQRRWFWRYKPTGLTQFRFPRPGDEYPEHVYTGVDGFDLAPEDRLASEHQVKRRATIDDEKVEPKATTSQKESGTRVGHMYATGYFDSSAPICLDSEDNGDLDPNVDHGTGHEQEEGETSQTGLTLDSTSFTTVLEPVPTNAIRTPPHTEAVLSIQGTGKSLANSHTAPASSRQDEVPVHMLDSHPVHAELPGSVSTLSNNHDWSLLGHVAELPSSDVRCAADDAPVEMDATANEINFIRIPMSLNGPVELSTERSTPPMPDSNSQTAFTPAPATHMYPLVHSSFSFPPLKDGSTSVSTHITQAHAPVANRPIDNRKYVPSNHQHETYQSWYPESHRNGNNIDQTKWVSSAGSEVSVLRLQENDLNGIGAKTHEGGGISSAVGNVQRHPTILTPSSGLRHPVKSEIDSASSVPIGPNNCQGSAAVASPETYPPNLSMQDSHRFCDVSYSEDQSDNIRPATQRTHTVPSRLPSQEAQLPSISGPGFFVFQEILPARKRDEQRHTAVTGNGRVKTHTAEVTGTIPPPTKTTRLSNLYTTTSTTPNSQSLHHQQATSRYSSGTMETNTTLIEAPKRDGYSESNNKVHQLRHPSGNGGSAEDAVVAPLGICISAGELLPTSISTHAKPVEPLTSTKIEQAVVHANYEVEQMEIKASSVVLIQDSLPTQLIHDSTNNTIASAQAVPLATGVEVIPSTATTSTDHKPMVEDPAAFSSGLMPAALMATPSFKRKPLPVQNSSTDSVPSQTPQNNQASSPTLLSSTVPQSLAHNSRLTSNVSACPSLQSQVSSPTQSVVSLHQTPPSTISQLHISSQSPNTVPQGQLSQNEVNAASLQPQVATSSPTTISSAQDVSSSSQSHTIQQPTHAASYASAQNHNTSQFAMGVYAISAIPSTVVQRPHPAPTAAGHHTVTSGPTPPLQVIPHAPTSSGQPIRPSSSSLQQFSPQATQSYQQGNHLTQHTEPQQAQSAAPVSQPTGILHQVDSSTHGHDSYQTVSNMQPQLQSVQHHPGGQYAVQKPTISHDHSQTHSNSATSHVHVQQQQQQQQQQHLATVHQPHFNGQFQQNPHVQQPSSQSTSTHAPQQHVAQKPPAQSLHSVQTPSIQVQNSQLVQTQSQNQNQNQNHTLSLTSPETTAALVSAGKEIKGWAKRMLKNPALKQTTAVVGGALASEAMGGNAMAGAMLANQIYQVSHPRPTSRPPGPSHTQTAPPQSQGQRPPRPTAQLTPLPVQGVQSIGTRPPGQALAIQNPAAQVSPQAGPRPPRPVQARPPMVHPSSLQQQQWQQVVSASPAVQMQINNQQTYNQNISVSASIGGTDGYNTPASSPQPPVQNTIAMDVSAYDSSFAAQEPMQPEVMNADYTTTNVEAVATTYVEESTYGGAASYAMDSGHCYDTTNANVDSTTMVDVNVEMNSYVEVDQTYAYTSDEVDQTYAYTSDEVDQTYASTSDEVSMYSMDTIATENVDGWSAMDYSGGDYSGGDYSGGDWAGEWE